MIEKEYDPMASLYGKLSEARKKIARLDWSPDGIVAMRGGGSGYTYISIRKMKAQIGRVLADCGLELEVDCMKPEVTRDSMQSHVLVGLRIRVVDSDTGECSEETAWGESSATGDRAVLVAETYAMKSWLSNKFLLAEGEDVEDRVAVVSQYTPQSEQEKAATRQKVLDASEPPKKKEAPDKSNGSEAVMSVPAPKRTADGSNGAQAELNAEKAWRPSVPQKKAIEKILVEAETALSSVEYEEIKAKAEALSSASEAVAFITEHRAGRCPNRCFPRDARSR